MNNSMNFQIQQLYKNPEAYVLGIVLDSFVLNVGYPFKIIV